MFADVCVDTCVDICTHMHIEMCADLCIDISAEMSADMRLAFFCLLYFGVGHAATKEDSLAMTIT